MHSYSAEVLLSEYLLVVAFCLDLGAVIFNPHVITVEDGGLGVIGSGSMKPDVLREHIQKCRAHTAYNFAVNIPLLFPFVEHTASLLIQPLYQIL